MIKVKVKLSGRPEDIEKVKTRLYNEKCIFVDLSTNSDLILLINRAFDIKKGLEQIETKYKQLNNVR